MCVHSREVWTLGKFKQKWDLAYHARTRLSSMFALKLQYKVESLTVSKRSRATCDFVLSQLGSDSWTRTGNGLIKLGTLYRGG